MPSPAASYPENYEELLSSSEKLVDLAIENRGQVATLRSSVGNIQSFNDTLCSGIWEDYLRIAMHYVDTGEWQEAHARTRSRLIGMTAQTLINQSTGELDGR